MVKKTYHTPKMEVYTIDDIDSLKNSTNVQDTRKVGGLIRCTTENKLSNLFSNWIDKDIKRHLDVLDLHDIKWDIDNVKDISDIKDIPAISDASYRQSVINIFSNMKEEKIWKNINFSDIPDKIEWICDYITIIKPQINYTGNTKKKLTKKDDLKNIWFNFIITAIRNWIMHHKYIITENGLYIKNEKAWEKKTNKKDENWNNIIEEQDFEAFIDITFFLEIIKFCDSFKRKQKYWFTEYDNLDREKWFDENIENIRCLRLESNKKWSLFSGIKDGLLRLRVKASRGKLERSISNFSNGQKELMSEYFLTHEFNRKNLTFLLRYVHDEYKNELFDLIESYKSIWWIESYFLWRKKRQEKLLEISNKGIDSIIIKTFFEWNNIYNWKIWQDDERIKQDITKKLISYRIPLSDAKENEKKFQLWFAKHWKFLEENILSLKYDISAHKDMFYSSISYRKNHLKVLYLSKFYVNNPKLELAQSQERKGNDLRKQWRDNIMKKCIKNSRSYWHKDVIKYGLDKKFWDKCREDIFKELTRWNIVDNWIIKNTDDINQIMGKIKFFRKKNVFHLTKNRKNILENNIRNVIKDWKEKLDTVTLIWEEEHIRNAFAHHNYTIVPWFNKILLWDPSIDDNPNWEKVYDLDELYQNAVNRVDEDYLDKKPKI